MENRDMNLFDFILFCCKSLWAVVKKLGVITLQFVRFCLHYCWVIIPFAILGVVCGWLWAKPFATMYRGEATIVYADGMRDVVHKGITDFFNLPDKVKSDLGIHPDLLDRFYRVELYNVIDCNNDSIVDFIDRSGRVAMSDTTNWIMRDRTHVVIKLMGSGECEPFKIALSRFFSSLEYTTKAHEHCKKIQQERLDYYTRELARLDSFSTYAYFERPVVSSFELVNTRDYQGVGSNLYYNDMEEVLKNKNYVEMQVLSTPDVINFQTPFILYAKPPMSKYKIGLMCGVVLGLAMALFLKYRREVFAYLKEK